uniref:Uncharacterized protein n=1 Tax=Rhizophora mucronata TaxID=61149 RepID=A0A2P2LJG3_RHIMU
MCCHGYNSSMYGSLPIYVLSVKFVCTISYYSRLIPGTCISNSCNLGCHLFIEYSNFCFPFAKAYKITLLLVRS